MPMFPLGSVLFPYMPLRLRVFEERYLIMLADLLKTDQARFGVVLIERGHEVGAASSGFWSAPWRRSPSSEPRKGSSA